MLAKKKREKELSTKVNILNTPYLVIVESPSKCSKIEQYLGFQYKCIASMGHIRELKHACERAVILGTESNYQIQDFGVTLDGGQTTNISTQPEQLSLEIIEKNTIQIALNQTTGNMSAAAKLLGLSRAALYRKLEKHGL